MIFDLVSNEVEDVIIFKVRTTFSGGFTHLSHQVSITITCGSEYEINASSTPIAPQFVAYNDS